MGRVLVSALAFLPALVGVVVLLRRTAVAEALLDAERRYGGRRTRERATTDQRRGQARLFVLLWGVLWVAMAIAWALQRQ